MMGCWNKKHLSWQEEHLLQGSSGNAFLPQTIYQKRSGHCQLSGKIPGSAIRVVIHKNPRVNT